MSWKTARWLVIDSETTGLRAEDERIIEIGFVLVENQLIVAKQSWLVHPDRDHIDPAVTAVNGIRIEDLHDKPKFPFYGPQLAALMKEVMVVAAYNVPFDRSFYLTEFMRCGLELPDTPWVDPLVWVREFDKFQKGKKLTEACQRRGIGVDNAHRADADAEMAARLMLHSLTKLPDNLQDLLTMEEVWRRKQDAEMKTWKDKKAKPSS